MTDAESREKKFGFLKTTLLGALLVVVPVGIVGFALWQVVRLVQRVLLPVIEMLPFDSTVIRVLVIAGALLAVILLCYLTGVAVRTRWGALLRGWIERKMLEKIPGYSIIRSLAHQYLGHEEERQFRPVMVDLHDDGTKAIGFEIEVLGDGTVAVFLPSVPAATIGQVRIVPEERLESLRASMHATLEAVTMFGVGSAKLVEGGTGDRGEEAKGEGGAAV